MQQWALSKSGWHIAGTEGTFDITKLDADDTVFEVYKNTTFYKERWINENGLEQRLIVTYSLKYRDYQREIRRAQLERATKLVQKSPQKIGKYNQNDVKRFISKQSITPDGEIAGKDVYSIDADRILKEEMFDGYYGICTNLEDDVQSILRINHQRWEIEESFRIMKTEFQARPVYLSRDDRIYAHFTTCFLALTLYRFLEKILKERFTCHRIIESLRNMNFYKVKSQGYIPTYVSDDFTDLLNEKFQLQTDRQIITSQEMKNIFKTTKNKKTLLKK
mgnify:FL=1